VTVSSETIGVWGSADPDDLAVITCAALRAAGVACSIRFKMSGELAVAIELFRGSDRSVLVASFPIQPIEAGVGLTTLECALEAMAGCGITRSGCMHGKVEGDSCSACEGAVAALKTAGADVESKRRQP